MFVEDAAELSYLFVCGAFKSCGSNKRKQHQNAERQLSCFINQSTGND